MIEKFIVLSTYFDLVPLGGTPPFMCLLVCSFGRVRAGKLTYRLKIVVQVVGRPNWLAVFDPRRKQIVTAAAPGTTWLVIREPVRKTVAPVSVPPLQQHLPFLVRFIGTP